MKLKINVLGIIVLSLFFTQCAKEQNQNVVECQIEGLENGDLVVFSLGESNQLTERIDSILYDGSTSKFKFKTRGKDVGATISITPVGEASDVKNRNKKHFFLEGYATLKIKANAKEMKYAEVSGGVYDLPKIEEIKKLNAKVWGKEKEAMDLIEELKKDSSDKELSRSLMLQADQIMKEAYSIKLLQVDSAKRKFVSHNPDVAYSAELLYGDTYFKENGSVLEFEDIFMQLSERVRKTRIGKTVYEYILAKKLTGIGREAPLFRAKTIAGNVVNIKDFKGKSVLLCFWETWEDYFLFALPERDKGLRSKVAEDKLVVVNVICGTQDFYEAKKPKQDKGWIYILAKNKNIQRTYGVQTYPSFFLMDAENKITAKGKFLVETIAQVKQQIEQ